MARSINAANTSYLLTIDGLFSTPQLLQGFTADDIFDTESVDIAETVMGIDGRLTAGYISKSVSQTITLQGDSPSCDVFDAWYAAEKAAKDIFFANAIVTLTGTSKTYVCTRGVLRSYSLLPNVKKTLQSRQFTIEFESIDGGAF